MTLFISNNLNESAKNLVFLAQQSQEEPKTTRCSSIILNKQSKFAGFNFLQKYLKFSLNKETKINKIKDRPMLSSLDLRH